MASNNVDAEAAFLASMDNSYDPNEAMEAAMNAEDEEEDDDDYDPSSFNFTEAEAEAEAPPVEQQQEQEVEPEQEAAKAEQDVSATLSNNTSQAPSRTGSTAPALKQPDADTKPKTVGGFIMEESDDEENGAPLTSQVNGAEGAQSGLGAVAVAEAHDQLPQQQQQAHANVSLDRPQDTAASSTSLNGSAHFPVSAVPNPLPSPSVAAMLGKTATPSVAPTPVPAASSAPLPNGSVPQTPTTAPTLSHRLPNDIVGQLEDRIKEDPRADTDAWMSLIAHYLERSKLDEARRTYDRFFQIFPTTVRNISLCFSHLWPGASFSTLRVHDRERCMAKWKTLPYFLG